MYLMDLNISLDHQSKQQWKVTSILVMLDLKLEKDTALGGVTQDVFLVTEIYQLANTK